MLITILAVIGQLKYLTTTSTEMLYNDVDISLLGIWMFIMKAKGCPDLVQLELIGLNFRIYVANSTAEKY